MPVDLYVGGPEHTVGHLLYARFWMKVLFDVGLVTHDEPFKKLAHQGMILGEDHQKMSKSKGNGIAADEVSHKYGADALRTFVCFMGPLESEKPWSTTGIEGVKRFLDRVSRLVVNDEGQSIATDDTAPAEVEKLLHKTIKKVTDDIEKMSFNTAISAMMILVNVLYRANIKPKSVLKPLTQLLMPFAPYLAEELWEKMGSSGFVSLAPWPKYDNRLVADDTVTMGVQVNGKMRGTIEIPVDASEAVAVAAAMELTTVSAVAGGKMPDKIIYKAGKILNLIVK
jgi:leucyl-tRNA synthetase